MRRLIALITLLLATGPALGWSKQGHQLVGELAERELTPAAREQVRLLLEGEPEPTLAGVSVWADEIRAEGTELGRRSRPWHYINFDREGCDYQPARECPDGNCIIGAINAQAKVLGDAGRPLQERREALKFVVHFIGDAHQPMHAGFRADRGGNSFQVRYLNEGSNLHGIWDYWLLRSAELDNAAYVERLLATPAPADPTLDADNPAAEWTLESCRLIDSAAIYPPKRRINTAYLDKHRPLAEQRIRLAGSRLARVINAALDPTD